MYVAAETLQCQPVTDRMNSLFAFLRLAALVLCTLLALGFCPVPFAFGVVGQVLRPRRLPVSTAALLGTTAFLLAWLGLNNVPLAFFGRTSPSFWPLWAASWLCAIVGCQYAAFLVRAFWSRRFARRPLPPTPFPEIDDGKSAAIDVEPVGLQDLRTTMRALRFWLHAIKWSAFGFAATLLLGFVSMGLLGLALYYPVAPVLRLRFAAQDAWLGDWVWPAVIGVGMGWSVGFLIAGVVNHFLVKQGWRASLRGLTYLGLLWLWDLVVWTLTLTFAPVRPPL